MSTEREAFEKWAKEETELDLHAPYENNYFYPATAWAWQASQTRAAFDHKQGFVVTDDEGYNLRDDHC